MTLISNGFKVKEPKQTGPEAFTAWHSLQGASKSQPGGKKTSLLIFNSRDIGLFNFGYVRVTNAWITKQNCCEDCMENRADVFYRSCFSSRWTDAHYPHFVPEKCTLFCAVSCRTAAEPRPHSQCPAHQSLQTPPISCCVPARTRMWWATLHGHGVQLTHCLTQTVEIF